MHLGGTVCELKATMMFSEFGRWIDYFNKHGRLTPMRMYDRSAALLATKLDQSMGHKSEMTVYLPFFKPVEIEATVEDIFKEFGGVRRGK